MDTNGARHLRKRLESHTQWRQAEAVRTGEQPAADPDAHDLVDFRVGVRNYRDGFRKCLVDGRWVAMAPVEDSSPRG
jgi:hypothetical protein